MGHVVITGGSGFIGSHLVEACLAQGHRVTAVDNLITGSYANVRHLAHREDFAFVQKDVSEGIFLSGPVDVVLHFASPASPLPGRSGWGHDCSSCFTSDFAANLTERRVPGVP